MLVYIQYSAIKKIHPQNKMDCCSRERLEENRDWIKNVDGKTECQIKRPVHNGDDDEPAKCQS